MTDKQTQEGQEAYNPNLQAEERRWQEQRRESGDGSSSGWILSIAMGLALVYAAITLSDAVAGGVKKGADGVGEVLDAAGEVAQDVAGLVDNIARMIGYTITWPELVRDAISFPEKEVAAIHDKWYSTLRKAAADGSLGGSALYVGYFPGLAVWPAVPENPSFAFASAMRERTVDWHPCVGRGFADPPSLYPDTYGCNDTRWQCGKVLGVVALHRSRNVMAIDGHAYAWPPEFGHVFSSLRAGQDPKKGWNVWPDGSAQHSTEGMVEAEMMLAPLYAVEGDSVPLGPTVFGVTSVQWLLEYGVLREYPMTITPPAGRSYLGRRPADFGEVQIQGGGDLTYNLGADWIVKVITAVDKPFNQPGGLPGRWGMAMIWSPSRGHWIFGDTVGLDPGVARTSSRMYFIGDEPLYAWKGGLDRGLPVGPAFRVMVQGKVDADWSGDSVQPRRGFIVAKARPRRRTFLEAGPEWYETTIAALGTGVQRGAILDRAKEDPTDIVPLDGTMRVFTKDGKLVTASYNGWLR